MDKLLKKIMMNQLLYLVVILLPVCSAQDIGRVFIGQRNRNITLTSLTFRVTSTTATVPVYIDAFRFNTATNNTDVVPITGNVRVTCEVTVQQTGYSTATFSVFTADNLNKDATIRLSNLNSGRQTNVQCYGESQQTGVTQFTKANSLSSTIPFTITKVPSFKLYPGQITTEVTSFSVLLLLEAVASDGTVGIRCQADTINSTTIVNQVLQNPLCFTTTSATVTTTTAPTPASNETNSTSPEAPIGPTDAPVVTPKWDILNPVFQLSPSSGQYSTLLKIARNLEVNTTIREYVVISCCSTNLGINISDSVVAVASLKPNVTVDWDKATDAASSNVERTIQNPAYSEVAPCACDLTGNACDVNCCCDQDCVNMTSVFSSCIPGLVGGKSAPTPEYKCSSDHFNKEDWFVFMCVQFEYNSLLGYFYSTATAIRKEETFNAKLTDENYYSYRETELRSPSYNSFGSVGYRYGSAVQSIKMTNTRVDNIGLVALPQRVLSGECLSTTPIHYLRDVKTDCSVQLTENLCSATGRFNSLFYVISTSANNPAYSGLYGILDTPLNQKISNVSVNYYCTTDFTGYIKSTVTSSVNPTGNFTFNYRLPTSCVNDACPTPDSTAQVTTTPTVLMG
ncbi:hypothetical protein KUTeg_010206 [Tegillarca granosa]|uniref:Tectonic domain-containing protein n=1 Tax=Tegillarca granosa TaxID=220873 RepID=A0ABQ9F629_TEGGR|nr:hypothetical protein KUTeg_010206 [Tegillarca granosa]